MYLIHIVSESVLWFTTKNSMAREFSLFLLHLSQKYLLLSFFFNYYTVARKCRVLLFGFIPFQSLWFIYTSWSKKKKSIGVISKWQPWNLGKVWEARENANCWQYDYEVKNMNFGHPYSSYENIPKLVFSLWK